MKINSIKRMFAVVAILASAVAMTGCATIVSGPSQSVTLAANAGQGGKYTLKDKNGHVVSQGQTPAAVSVSVSRSDAPYILTVEKDGKVATATMNKGFNGWYVGNIVFGGIVGLVVDACDGAMFTVSPDSATATVN